MENGARPAGRIAHLEEEQELPNIERFATAHREFLQWVTSEWAGFSPAQQSLSHLILNNFDEIAAAGVARSKRGHVIARLIAERALGIPHDSQPPAIAAENVSASWDHRLAKLEVGPFRGFSKAETFNFDRRFAVIYGPNGSGKSSFSEALEYSMLGSIQEAQAKRIDLPTYVKNIVTGKFVSPRLYLQDKKGGREALMASPNSKTRFCFIERNRIESFSRISASTAGDQQDRIASLFGLDEFKEFVNGFNDTLDNCLDLVGKKGQELNERKRTIADQSTLIARATSNIYEVARERREICQKIEWKRGFGALKRHLEGQQGSMGEIERLRLLLEQPIKSKLSLPTEETLQKFSECLHGKWDELIAVEALVELKKDQLDYAQLYESLSSLAPLKLSACPACQTPLTSTMVDPFAHAREQLETLQELVSTKANLRIHKEELNQILDDILEEVEAWNCALVSLAAKPCDKPVIKKIVETESSKDIQPSIEAAKQVLTYFGALPLTVSQDLARYNDEIEQATNKKVTLSAQREIYRKISTSIAVVETKLSDARSEIQTARDKIEAFNREQSDLIKEVEDEKVVLVRNFEFHAAYRSLLSQLRAYVKTLPGKFATELSDLTLYFYNEINKNDNDFDKLSVLRLPSSAGEGIRICFTGSESEHNALNILSEGHIRCLGLSILLAKNVKEKSPVLIFDDVVNAIDDDHRHSIIELLCHDKFLEDKQMIITSHGEEFVRAFESELALAEMKKCIKRYDFFAEREERTIFIKEDNSRHYLAKAERSYKNQEWKDSLGDCRRALESISRSIWKTLGKRYKPHLNVSMLSPSRPPELSSVVDSLCLTIPDRCADGDNLLAIPEKLKEIKIDWDYLNRGAHDQEENEEPDRIRLKRLLTNLIELEVMAKAA